MQLGIYVNAQHPDRDDPRRRFAEMVEQARLIRALGFDSLWGGEHHATPGFHYFPLLPLLQRLAAETDGMWVGTNLVLLPLHNPVEIAEIGAFLDVVTGGRFLLGVGLGYRPEEFQLFGVSLADRVSRLVEGVEIIRRLWTEDRVSHAGRHWRFDGVSIRPRPVQSPRPPILVGSQVPAGIARAARIADGWLVVPTLSLDELAEQGAAFRTARAAEGGAPHPANPEICRLLEVACGSDEETAIRRAAPFLLAKYAAYLSWGLTGLSLATDAPPEEQLRRMAADRFAVGSPERVIEALVAQHRAGVTHAMMRVSWPGMGQEDVLASLELLGRLVLPEVRRRTMGEAGRR